MRPDYEHHCTLTYTRRDFTGNQSQQTIHLIGTEEEIAAHVSRSIVNGLHEGHGPYVFTPTHPASVIRLADR